MSFEDRTEIPTRQHPNSIQIPSSSMNQGSVVAASCDMHLAEASARQDYEPNQPAPAETLSPRSLFVKPRSNDKEVGSDPYSTFLAAAYKLNRLTYYLQHVTKLTYSESIMKLALSEFKDMSSCDSRSWNSNIDDLDLEHDSTFWSIGSVKLSSSNPHGYYPVAKLQQKVADSFSAPAQSVVASECARIPAPWLHGRNIESPTIIRKRTQSFVGKEAKSRSIYESLDFIDGEPTEHDVFLGRGGKANTHIGNFYWLEEKAKLQPQYTEASKGTKKLISQQLVDRILSKGGRFLLPVKFQEKPPVYRYSEVRDKKALLRKASQTLRETNSPEEAKRKHRKT